MFSSTSKSARRALRPFFVYSLFEGCAPIYPVYMIMFAGWGYDFTSLSFLLSIWALPVVFLELPSGVLADRWSKKGVVAIGMAMKALCFMLWAVSPTYWAAALGFVFWGCQEALCSGARQALVYEALKERGLESEYEAAIGLFGSFEMAAIVVSEIAGSAIYAFSPYLALGISALSAACGAVTAAMFREKRLHVAGSGPAGIFAGLRKSLKARYLIPLLAAACIATAAYGTIDEYDTLWAMGRYGIPTVFIGAWGASGLALQGLGGLLAGRFSALFQRRKLAVALMLAGVSFAASAFIPGLWGIPIYWSYYFIMAALSVIFEGRLQAAAEDASRASFLSFSSLLMDLCAVFLSPFLGMAGDSGGLGWVIAICGGLTLFSGMIAMRAKG